ncbi:MAG: 3-dehydroquinate synthase [Bacteroidales bacterium]|nr:3-dehydroquinate synthase [Bacteroidales bacterium]MDD4671197.1 3-dehydroquinate synthase [Bacteroidales bacterium]
MAIPEYIHIDYEIGHLDRLIRGRKLYAVIDKNVADTFYPKTISCHKIVIEAEETKKTLDTVEYIVSELIKAEADRDCFLLGIGGGITTDICAFTASIYKRGVAFGLVPTTLLAQIDASIGGKNGVNFDHYKNMIGTIRIPEFVFIDPNLISSISKRDMGCGIAEMVKTFIIADSEYYRETIAFFKKAGMSYEPWWKEKMADFIGRAVEIKSNIVEMDLYDTEARHLLNLGHTFGHAIEKNCHDVKHGEAVAIGIIIASKISVRLGLMSENILQELISDFESIGLPVDSPVAVSSLLEAVENDKKRTADAIDFILPVSIGTATSKLLSSDRLKSLTLGL